MRSGRALSPFTIVVLSLLVVAGVYAWGVPVLHAALENISLESDPTAQRAFDLGEEHFNAITAGDYDRARAKYFFEIAAKRDPLLPSVDHELARIDFLNGNFVAALGKINFQIAMHGDTVPNSYYVRGLIEGYMGDYTAAAKDYEHYLRFDPNNWAALNDYTWVLLKAGEYRTALLTAERGISLFPENAWLLNSLSIAQYENGNVADALTSARDAVAASGLVTEREWLTAYPGNDPKLASTGIATLQHAALANMHSIEAALASNTVQ